MNDKGSTAPEIAAAELILTRMFAAPRELVFKAWTEPERLVQWWGAKGTNIHVSAFELRPGGVFHYSQQPPTGGEVWWGRFVFNEIVAPERLVFTTSFADAEGNIIRAPFSINWPEEILNTLTLASNGAQTTLILRSIPVNVTEAERQTFAAAHAGLEQGFQGTFQQLDHYLAGAQA